MHSYLVIWFLSDSITLPPHCQALSIVNCQHLWGCFVNCLLRKIHHLAVSSHTLFSMAATLYRNSVGLCLQVWSLIQLQASEGWRDRTREGRSLHGSRDMSRWMVQGNGHEQQCVRNIPGKLRQASCLHCQFLFSLKLKAADHLAAVCFPRFNLNVEIRWCLSGWRSIIDR